MTFFQASQTGQALFPRSGCDGLQRTDEPVEEPAIALTLAKGKGNSNWAEEAALRYEAKASDAMKKGEPEVAKIYKRMAQIKRAAGAASSKGKKFDCS